MLYLLLLLLSACTTTPTTYQRGSLAPAPAPVRPGVGAPVYDPPHAPGPRMQPQPPPTRFLPETPGGGPGIWATAPIAKDTGDDGEPDGGPRILDVALPVAEPYGSLDLAVPTQCAAELSGALTASRQERAVIAWSPEQRRCAVKLWYEHCVKHKASTPGLDADVVAALRRALDAATNQRKQECAGDGALATPEKVIWSTVLTHWLARGRR